MQQKVFDVEGMTCAACAARVEKVVGRLPGVQASVNLAAETLVVTCPEGTNLPDVAAAVERAGFTVKERTQQRHVNIPVGGMTCAACAARVEKVLNRLPGVQASVNLATETVSAAYDPALTRLSDLRGAIEAAGYQPLTAQTVDERTQRRQKDMRVMRLKLIIALVFTLPLFYLAMGPMVGLPVPAFLNADNFPVRNALTQLLLTLPVMAAGYRFYINGFGALARRAPNMDSLVALGTSAAFLYSVYGVVQVLNGHHHAVHNLYFESTAVIIALIMLGKTLEALSKGRTGQAIRALMQLAPATAMLITQAGEKEIPAEEVEPGDLLLVRPGARIPVDGVVKTGHTAVDEAMLTGESMPRDKQPGDKLYAGTLNTMGAVTMRADQVGQDTALSQIIKLVENAQGSKAPIAQLADKVSAVFVPVVAAIALIAGLAWLAAGHFMPQVIPEGVTPIGFALTVMIAVLVIACPCALGLATPTAIMVGTGLGAQHGILIKSGEALETAHKVDAMIFDKTGTITLGQPQVTALEVISGDAAALLELAAAAEQGSEHPLGQAIVAHARKMGVPVGTAAALTALPGRGVEAAVNGQRVLIGNAQLMQENHVDTGALLARAQALAQQGQTPMYVAADGRLQGLIAVADVIRPTSRQALAQLKRMGIQLYMITGDNERTAQAIAHKAGIDHVLADVLPQDKAQQVAALQQQGHVVAMVGDGINDAPALAQADVGIAIGTGTDVAIESADIVLMHGDLNDVPTAMALSRRTMRTIRQNLFWAFAYNVIGIPVAAGVLHIFGGPLLNPMFAAAAMSLSSVSVISNALRLRSFRPPTIQQEDIP